MSTDDAPTIDELSNRARAAGDVSAQSDLWRAMFALDEWYFMASGGLPDGGPVVGIVDGVPSLLAFTTAGRARACGLANGKTEEDANQVLSVPREHFLDMCDQLAHQGVERLVVDQGTLGFFAPLDQLRAMHGFINPPTED
ncbi:hypothetical protein N802_19310 [Knoellia sinensis KCTC 19936]|uniref:SseB protein N-terminal domain-containing protein n=1 Tax=Knoellia sinensis KCTC 19936 TaxID=1385520 RepID=A0A0A0J5D8_9MICO|nr:hypothetical protein [Knoellia sinensis]KGN31964.1 hypothetical protein N802_19310 [Knoellia sinensis KCTC 19936]